MIVSILKKIIRYIKNVLYDLQVYLYIKKVSKNKIKLQIEDLSLIKYKTDILRFVSSVKIDEADIKFRYSASCYLPTLYSSVYACMIYSIIGELQKINEKDKVEWISYFDSFQNPKDGLFYDSVIENELYEDTDWWGARHLALHIIRAYVDLGGKPKHPFHFLKRYYNHEYIAEWLDAYDWSSLANHEVDIDNKIMNIGCLLQYQRDSWSDKNAGDALLFLRNYLVDRINHETGMWGKYNSENPAERSRMVQFAYHLFPILFYDDQKLSHTDVIVDIVLKTQNAFGGFGVKNNSSACEDMDSIYILCKLASDVPERKTEIDIALRKAWVWIQCNQVEDGGFVFRLNEYFKYGHHEMSSKANQGAMFPTWFRLLSLAYIGKYFGQKNLFYINSSPGY